MFEQSRFEEQRFNRCADPLPFRIVILAVAGEQRQQAIERLKLVFANPFLDTLRQERIRLNVEPEDRWKPTAGQVLVTLLDLQAPAPTPGKRPKP